MEKKMFGFYVYARGDKSVGVVMAKDATEAEEIVMRSFHLDSVADASFKELQFSPNGICEIYYGG